MRKYALVLLPALMGCTAHYKVKPITPAQLATEQGFIYYPPKPYLVLTNLVSALGKDENASAPATTGTSSGDHPAKPNAKAGDDTGKSTVSASIIYLPDLKRPRAVTTTGSLGTFKGSLTLTNGWMLTGVSSEADAKVAETVTAFSGVLTSLFKASGLPTGKKAEMNYPSEPFFYLLEIDLEHDKPQLHLIDPGCLKELFPANHLPTQGSGCQ